MRRKFYFLKNIYEFLKLEFTVFEKLNNDEHLLVYQMGSKYKEIVMASPSKA